MIGAAGDHAETKRAPGRTVPHSRRTRGLHVRSSQMDVIMKILKPTLRMKELTP